MKSRQYLFVLGIIMCVYLNAQTQAEMNRDAANAFKDVDAELNQVYAQILKDYADDPVFIEALRDSQRNWITFRDSELKMKFPNRQPGWYGSMHPMCISYYMSYLTKDRVKTLKAWIDGVEEGDGCRGSAKTNFESETPGVIESVENDQLVTLINGLTFLESYRTDELLIQLFSIANHPGSAGLPNSEVTHNILIGVSEYDELPEQRLYRINNLYAPKILSLDSSNPKSPILRIQHKLDGVIEEVVIRVSIEQIERM